MPQKAPGRHYRKGISWLEAADMFGTEAAAEAWFIAERWPDGVACPKCGSLNVQARPTRKPQPFRCRDCRADFSVKTDTLMHGSNLPLRKWALAFFMMATELKGRSSMKIHRDLHVTQKTAWHLMHRIRETWNDRQTQAFLGPVEIDETFVGGKRSNMHASKRAQLAGRGATGKAIVAGIVDRDTNRIAADVVPNTTRGTLTAFMRHHVAHGAVTYTDGESSFARLPHHETVNHTAGEYVRGAAHVNAVESFWAMFKRGYRGTFHVLSPEQLHRYVREFRGRHNQRDLDTADQLRLMVRGAERKRLRYADLINHGHRAVARGPAV